MCSYKQITAECAHLQSEGHNADCAYLQTDGYTATVLQQTDRHDADCAPLQTNGHNNIIMFILFVQSTLIVYTYINSNECSQFMC